MTVLRYSAVEERLRNVARYRPEWVAVGEHLREHRRRTAGGGRDRELRQAGRESDAHLSTRGVKLGLGGPHVQAARHERGRQAHGQILRQAQGGELERLLRLIAGEPARQRRQQVAGLLKLLLQRGQRLLDLRERGFLRGYVESGHCPQVELAPKQRERPRTDVDDLLG